MQKVQLADRLGNVQTKKVGFSWLHFFFGPFYCFVNLKFVVGIGECLFFYYFLPIPGMNYIVDLIHKISFLPTSMVNYIGDFLNLFRTNYYFIISIFIVLAIHTLYSFRIKGKVLKRHIRKKQLRPVEEKDARILIKWGVVDDNVGLAESFDIRGTTKYKSAEENWYENNQVRIKSRPSFSTRSNIRYTSEQKVKIQNEQLENLLKLGLITKEEYTRKKNELTRVDMKKPRD